VHIRPERPDDTHAILRLVERAFASAPHSNGCEQFIVSALRKAGALTVSLVAEEAGDAIGHVAFSPVSLTDGSSRWYGLGPVAVEPSAQGVGVGSALIRAGLDVLREIGAAGCVVLGEPGYYERFGFRPMTTLRYPGPPPEYFLALAFGDSHPYGEVSYHAAFAAKA
jgi:putative acetyltransferase